MLPPPSPFASPPARRPRPQVGENWRLRCQTSSPPKPRRQTFSPPKRQVSTPDNTRLSPGQKRVSLVIPHPNRSSRVRLGHALPRELESTFGEIAFDGIGRAGGVGEGDIGIGPQEIERVAREARCLMLRPPGKLMQFDVTVCAQFGEFGPRLAVDMD